MRYRREIYEAYDDMIDECYADVLIFGVPRCASWVFKVADPIMYEQGLDEWLDSLATDGEYCLQCDKFSHECMCFDEVEYEEEE